MFSVNIIGCGKLGKTIGRLIVENNAGKILGIVNASLESGKIAAEFIGQGRAYKNMSELPQADLYFITTKDDLIEDIANQLHVTHRLKEGAIVLHCSGSFSSDVLSQVKKNNCFIASIHPIKSFAQPTLVIKNFSGTYCALEGDEEAISIIKTIFAKIGAVTFPIKKENKSIYHAGGVIANNYLITLHYYAMQCYINAGVDPDTATKIVSMLMKDALDNVNHSSHREALTGPIQRGDIKTILNHLSALKDAAENDDDDSEIKDLYQLYSLIGKATINLTDHELLVRNMLLDIFNEK